jgi:4'-phosphopantetheinyl transferase
MVNKLYFLQMTNHIDETKFQSFLNLVSSQKQEQIKRYHFDIDKKLSLYSELIIRMIACQELNILNDKIIFEKEKYGKPYIKDHQDFCYNISHTRNAIVVCVSDNPVGVDIESIRKADMRIAKRFFTNDELIYITQSETDKDRRFFEIWTKKEAYIKYIGRGLSMPLNSFDVLNITGNIQIYNFEKYGYSISLCHRPAETNYEFIELFENDFKEKNKLFCH